jgi:hypothetical protein
MIPNWVNGFIVTQPSNSNLKGERLPGAIERSEELAPGRKT